MPNPAKPAPDFIPADPDFIPAVGQPQQQNDAPATQSSPSTPLQKAFGVNPVKDTLGTAFDHAKNLVTGPVHAFMDDPRGEREKSVVDAGGGGVFGRYVGLPLDRITGASQSAESWNKANSLKGDEAVQAREDAIPIVGPWAKQIESDVQNKGIAPALAGLAVDAFAPKPVAGATRLVRSLAPGVAEGALNISKVDRGYGKTPGRAILDETRGVRPETIQRSANQRLNDLGNNIDQMAKSHRAPVDITPAQDYVDQQIGTAKARNNAGGVQALQPVKAQLTENPFQLNQAFAPPTVGNPNAVLTPFQTAEGALNLKRGLRDQFVKNWNPDAGPQLAKDVARGASGVIDRQLDHALGPEFTKTNQRISSLIPVQDAAESIQRNAGIGQKIGGRLKAHTGALAGGIAGSAAGHAAAGPMGALVGGTLGLVGPEVIGSPTAQMTLARALDSKVPGKIAPAIASGGIVTPRKKREE